MKIDTGFLAKTFVSALAGAGFLVAIATSVSAGEIRTLSLYHVHTKERITITYKKDGQYIPSAMAQLNYFLRDWRKNRPTTMSPRTIDLMWELHEDLGSKAPIYIICGYRSAETNLMLKRIGRHVATQSQHVRGNAIDMFFPDVPLEKLRNSALVRQVGGVGYYPSSAGGFVHIDSGNVRHWPRISDTKLASIFRESASTVGARRGRGGGNVEVASVQSQPSRSLLQRLLGTGTDNGDDEAPTAADAAATQPDPTPAPAQAPAETADAPAAAPAVVPQPKPELPAATVAAMVPKPQPKPIEVLMLAAANMHIEPASAPVPKVSFAERSVQASEGMGPVNPDDNLTAEPMPSADVAQKGDFAQELLTGTTAQAPTIRPLDTNANGDIQYAAAGVFSTEKLLRYDGAPQPFLEDGAAAPAQMVAADLSQPVKVVRTQVLTADGTTDLQPALLATTASMGPSAKGDFLASTVTEEQQPKSLGSTLLAALSSLFSRSN
ncbi:MAG: DUF882 domain-containing protein [Hyphomicrobiales bacterium]